jgi:hypothetical protein
MSARALLIIFAKAPVAGEVNTRLIPDIMQQYGKSDRFDVQLWCAPDVEHEVFQRCARENNISLHLQQGHDLGSRMSHAFSVALKNYGRVALIGTDAPALNTDTVASALDTLETHEVVIVPAEDGGYVLIAMRDHFDKVFLSVPWGSSQVLRKTRGNIVAQALRYKELETCWDIDRLEDYRRYRAMFQSQ